MCLACCYIERMVKKARLEVLKGTGKIDAGGRRKIKGVKRKGTGRKERD